MSLTSNELNSYGFNYPTALFLAKACAIAYDVDPVATAKTALGLTKVSFHSVGDTEYLIGETDTFAVLVFRGTQEPFDAVQDVRALQSSAKGITGLVHTGFRSGLDFVWDAIDQTLGRNLPFFVTGHSLGGGIATLAACRLAKEQRFVAGYTFGSPRVGDSAFCSTFKSFGQAFPWRNYRVVNHLDIVPELPPTADEVRFLEGFTTLGQAFSRGNRFFQRALLPTIAKILDIGDSVRLVIPPQHDIEQLFTLLDKMRPFQGQVGNYEHVTTLVTLEKNGDVTINGPELRWALSLLREVFQGASPSIALQCHKMQSYISALTDAANAGREPKVLS